MKKLILLCIIMLVLILACSDMQTGSIDSSYSDYEPDFETRYISAPGGDAEEYNIYLIKVNTGTSAVSARDTGTAIAGVLPVNKPPVTTTENDEENDEDDEETETGEEEPSANTASRYFDAGVKTTDSDIDICCEPDYVQEFNKLLYSSFKEPAPQTLRLRNSMNMLLSTAADSYVVDSSSKYFWIIINNVWKKIPATLRAQGDKCNVWVADVNFSNSTLADETGATINKSIAKNLKENFDTIYDIETAILGYERGGGPGGDGGIDKDTRVQILVYDIDGDAFTPKDGGKTVGYFWSKDEMTQEKIDEKKMDLKSNHAEIFYIDSHYASLAPNMTYSTLVHEFQHMINYNQKNIERNMTSAGWYNEMLSMLAEDMISPIINISSGDVGHPVRQRIPLFLQAYSTTGVAKWETTDSLKSYAVTYAFGAYMARNFGGPELVRLMLSNSFVDDESISAALAECSLNMHNVRSFKSALESWPNAMLYTKPSSEQDGIVSYNNTITETLRGVIYRFDAFDISKIAASGQTGEEKQYGINISPLIAKKIMEPGSVQIQTCDYWKNITNKKVAIKIEKPSNSNVKLIFYAIPKKTESST